MAKSLKKLLSLVIAVVMVLSLIPAVSAAGESEADPILVGTTEEWNEQVQAISDATEAKTLFIKLTADIVLDRELKIPAGMEHNVTVDMDGHKFTSEAAVRAFNVWAGTLTVKNGTIEMPGINETSTSTDYANSGGLIIAYKADLNLTSVTVKKVETDNAVNNAGVLLIREATVTMTDSHIQIERDDTSDAVYGGAVYLVNTGAELSMVRSTISGGFASDYGGNVTIAGTATLNIGEGSSIYNGKSGNTSARGGGNIYVGAATSCVNLNGGSIYGGTSAYGGGNVRLNAGTMIINSGSIYGGKVESTTTPGGGGNLYLGSADAHLVMNSGYIYDGTVTAARDANGGNICAKQGTITLNDGEIYNGTATSTETATTSKYYARGGNIYLLGAKLYMSDGKIYDGSTEAYYGAQGGNLFMTKDSNVYPVVVMTGGQMSRGQVEGQTTNTSGASIALYNGRIILDGGKIGNGTRTRVDESVGDCVQLFWQNTTSGIGSSGIVDGTAVADDQFLMYSGKVGIMTGPTLGPVKLYNGQTVRFDPNTRMVQDCATYESIGSIGGEQTYQITHKNVDGTDNDVDHTCTEDGAINVECTNCTFTYDGVTYGGSYTYADPAPGHDMKETAAQVDATCEANGSTAAYTCANGCGKTEGGETITKLGHDMQLTAEAVAATCEADGKTAAYACANNCGTTEGGETIKATGHAWDEGVKTEGTFEADAYITYTCKTDSTHTKKETIEGTKLTAVAVDANGKKYATLQAAVDAGGEITIMTDIALDAAVRVAGKVTINLANHTISMTKKDTVGDGVFYVTGNLTINGEGTVNGCSSGNGYCIAVWANEGGVVTINGGTYTNVGAYSAEDGEHFDLIYVKNGGRVIINGGTFIAETPRWTLNSKNPVQNGSFEVYGGSFHGFDPSNVDTDDDVDSWLTDDYRVVVENGVYTVVKKVNASINTDPADVTAKVIGENVKFSVGAVGDDLTYLWLYHRPNTAADKWYYWANPTKGLDEITVAATVARDGYQFKCVVTDAYGNKIDSNAATLDIETEDAIKDITGPADVKAVAGQTATFTVEAEGTDLTYLWKYSKDSGNTWYYWAAPAKNMVEISVPATLARDGYQFKCELTDANGVKVTTEPATLNVEADTTQVDVTYTVEDGKLTLNAKKDGDYTYLWLYQRPGMAADKWYYYQNPGKAANAMSITISGRDGYQFKCQLTDSHGNKTYTAIYAVDGNEIVKLP